MQRHVLLGLSVLASPTVWAEPQPLGVLWQRDGEAITLATCPPGDHDEYCRAIDVRRREDTVRLGAGYMRVTLLWSRRARASSGPDAVVLGDYGGSGGRADLFVVTLRSGVPPRAIGGERFDQVAVVGRAGPLRLQLPFDIEFFNGAPHAGSVTVPLPVEWARGDFAVDLGALTGRTFTRADLDFRMLAVRQELGAWARDDYPTVRLYPPEARDGTPVTLTTMVEMILAGHADQARALLARAWPRDWEHADRPLGGEDAFWAAICGKVIGNPLWQRFDLSRLPHADLVRQSAGGGAQRRRVPG